MNVSYINHYLTDQDVANFARQSFGKKADEYTEEQNNNLVRFLARGMSSPDWEASLIELLTVESGLEAHELAVSLRKIPEHWVPFGHPHITLAVSAPVPIRTQCFKHKIGYVESEESRRYISSDPFLYVPEHFRAKAQNVKQGSGEEHHNSAVWMEKYIHQGHAAISLYRQMVADGVCPEQARFVLPQGCEVKWIWTGSLYAYANFYNQRADPHAQREVQMLAEKVDSIIAPLYPVSWAALTRGEY